MIRQLPHGVIMYGFLVAVAATLTIMAFGVSGGIERVNKVMMPALFILFVFLGIYIFTAARSRRGIQVYFYTESEGTYRSEAVDLCFWTGFSFPCLLRETER